MRGFRGSRQTRARAGLLGAADPAGGLRLRRGQNVGLQGPAGGRRRAEGPWEVPQLQRERERGGQGERRTGGAGSAGFPESEVLIPGLYLNLSPLISVF